MIGATATGAKINLLTAKKNGEMACSRDAQGHTNSSGAKVNAYVNVDIDIYKVGWEYKSKFINKGPNRYHLTRWFSTGFPSGSRLSIKWKPITARV